MIKIKLVGKNLADIRKLLPEYGLVECDSGFDLVISHGGDGALLGAEREYPGVVKLPLRDTGTAPTCPAHPLPYLLESFVSGKLNITRLPKVAGVAGSHRVTGINDIFIHNNICSGALRYSVRIDGELYAPEILGDGVGLSTVHGSTGYYRSITHSTFRVGVGLAFSNSTVEISHLVLAPESKVEVSILRGPGILIADNSPVHELPGGSVVEMFQSDEYAEIYGLELFMCPDCRQLRHRRGSR